MQGSIINTFIEENIELIDSSQFDKLYTNAYTYNWNTRYIGKLTHLFFDAGINPLLGLTYIPEYFLYGGSVGEFDIPQGITQINLGAFQDCLKLTTVVIPDTVKLIGDSAFEHCMNLSSVTFSDNSSLRTISLASFASCPSLKQIKIPSGCETIEEYAFQGCHNLVKLILPDSVGEIYKYAIPQGCTVYSSNNAEYVKEYCSKHSIKWVELN